jgi:acetylornithine deacetylase/succinyl-diaminopimelate desuccinylase-like protein
MESVQFRNWLAALRASVNIPAGTSQTLTTGTSPHSTTPAAMECVQPDNRLAATLPSVNHPAGTTQTLDTNVLPHSTTPAAMENLQPSNRLAATLASLARAEAEAEAEARQPRTKAKQYEAAISKNSEWMPEYLVPLLPPPSNDAANNEHVLRVFWNHVRTNSQHWQVCLTVSKTFMFILAHNTIACNGSSNGQIRRSNLC